MYYKGYLVFECLSVFLFQRSQYSYSMEGHVDRTSLLDRAVSSQKVLRMDMSNNNNINI